MVYRRNPYSINTSSTYVAVPGSYRIIRVPSEEVIKSSFMCKREVIERNQLFKIKENDVIGSCILRSHGIHSLHIISRNETLHRRTYQLKSKGNNRCRVQLLNTIASSNLKLAQSNILHLHAEIGEFIIAI